MNHFLRLFLLLAIFDCTSFSEVPAKSSPVSIWPKSPPGEGRPQGREHDTTTAKDASVGGKGVIRLTDVTKPAMTVYHPRPEANTGTAIVIFPGGGYRFLPWIWKGPRSAIG